MHAYIDAHSQRLIEECPGDGLQAILILQYQCANMTFDDQSRYNRIFQQEWESAINYIKIFQSDKALEISVGKSYTEDQVMRDFLDNS